MGHFSDRLLEIRRPSHGITKYYDKLVQNFVNDCV